jgi:hypothetical protein
MNFGLFGSIRIIQIKSKVKWKNQMCTWAETGQPSLKIGEGTYGSSGSRRSAHPATTGGEGGGESVLGHEGVQGSQ